MRGSYHYLESSTRVKKEKCVSTQLNKLNNSVAYIFPILPVFSTFVDFPKSGIGGTLLPPPDELALVALVALVDVEVEVKFVGPLPRPA